MSTVLDASMAGPRGISSTPPPSFRNLTPSECRYLLARHSFGRLAYTFHDRVDVVPISYVYVGGALVFRTAPGSKLEILAHHRWAALEIDEVEGPSEWRSVVVHGSVYVLDEEGSPAEARAYRSAVRALTQWNPTTLAAGDPTPFRTVVAKLHIDRMTGRAATTL
jgi:nitroimidazol reductase NimA-like FMN-containing flavoprotein (pyridoxamine 5'-phosphate oxidase superfamily)